MNKYRKFLFCMTLLFTMLLFTMGTYAWIARSWTPQIEYPKMSIATTGALIIAFEDENGEESVYNEVDMNELSGLGEFALKQVSSLDGREFISANFNPILDGGVPIYDENIKGKYIETEFWVKTQYEADEELKGRIKEVYIHPDSYIKYNPADENDTSENAELAIRISIELENINGNKPYILCESRNTPDGADLIYSNSLVAALPSSVGKNIFTAYPDDTTLLARTYQTHTVYDLNYFDGSSSDRVLFTLDAASVQKVTVRIWLEGCDDYCVNEIAGKALSLLLKFDSREVYPNK